MFINIKFSDPPISSQTKSQRFSYKLPEKKILDYCQALSAELSILSSASLNQMSVVQASDELHRCPLGKAHELFKYKVRERGFKHTSKPWFDDDCKSLRSQFQKLIKDNAEAYAPLLPSKNQLASGGLPPGLILDPLGVGAPSQITVCI